MPIIESGFRAPWFLRNGHLQTFASVLLPAPDGLAPESERLELADGDFLDLSWSRRGSKRLAVLCHGLEGHAGQNYIRRMSAVLVAAGWDVLAWNFRGCTPGESNRALRFYHSGETGDLRLVIERAEKSYGRLALIGFSLGANVALKYLGEHPPHPKIIGAVAVSAPVELAASTRELDTRWGNRTIYVRRFLRTLAAKVEAKAKGFPNDLDPRGIRAMRTFREFDDRYTARVHGYADADDYWRQSSSRQFLPNIQVPTLMLSARDDPFLPGECFPWPEAENNPHLNLEAPLHGGHVGFIDGGTLSGGGTWSERRAVEFLAAG